MALDGGDDVGRFLVDCDGGIVVGRLGLVAGHCGAPSYGIQYS